MSSHVVCAIGRIEAHMEINNSWLLSSTSTYHVCNELSHLKNVQEIEPFNIEFSDKRIHNVLYVNNDAANLVSARERARGGDEIAFDKD
eukprot:360701-Chlamydomonas_euryale.AAC.5